MIKLTTVLLFSIASLNALSFEEMIEQTLKTHPDAHIATMRYESVIEETKSSESALYPKIDLNSVYYPTKTYVMPSNGVFSTKENDGFHADVTGTYSLWDAGRSKNRANASLSAQEGSQSNKKLSQNELVEQVWLRYYQIAYTASLMVVAESSVAFYEEQFNQARNMRLSGLKTEADELRFKASLLEGNDRLKSVKAEYDKASLSLKLLIGSDDIGTITKSDLDQKADTIFMNYTLETLRNDLRRNNPNLKALQSTISQNKQLSDAAAAERYGEIALVAQAGYDDSLSTYDTYQAGVAGSIPLYDGGKLSAQAQKSRIALSIAQQEYEKTQRALWQELYDAYRDGERSDETIRAKEGIIIASTKTLRLIEERYKQGLATYIDVLESKNTLDNAYAGSAQAKYQKIRVFARIQKLLNEGCWYDICKK